MSARGGRKLRPIAVLCALVLLVWGVLSAGSVAAHIQMADKFGWPQHWGEWSTWTFYCALAAACVGALAILWGLLGLRWRPPLHLGALCALVAIVLTVVEIAIQTQHGPSIGDVVRGYRDGLAWRSTGSADIERWWSFTNDAVLPGAVIVLIVGLLVLITGAGRPRSADAFAGRTYESDGFAAPAFVGQGAAQDRSAQEAPLVSYAPPAAPESAPASPDVAPAAQAAPAEAQPAVPVQPAEAGARPVAPVAHVPDEKPIRVDGPTVVRGAAPPADHDRVWFVTVQGADHGPYTRAQLRAYAEEGRLHAGTVTHLQGGENQPLSQVLA